MEYRRTSNVAAKNPRELDRCNVWPKDRAHLLEDGYDYEHVATLLKSGITISEALLRFHYPTLYADERVLFCDTGDHVLVYIAVPVDVVIIGM